MYPASVDLNALMSSQGNHFVYRAFTQMLRIRRIEEEIARRYVDQEMRTPVHLCVGQEAVPVGVSLNLYPEDKVFSGHRSHGHYLAKGGNLAAMIAELYGRVTGCSRGKGGSQHLIDLSCGFLGSAPILGSTIAIAVGASWALRKKDPGSITVAYFGDAATEEGVFHEALSFASLHHLPVLFVCENNLYSTHAPLSVRQPARPIEDLASAHGIPGSTVDGNDVESIFEATAPAVERARKGEGPSFLVFDTYRYLEHVGPGSDLTLGYRSDEELDRWLQRDPLLLLSQRMSQKDPRWSDFVEEFEVGLAKEIEKAFEFARSSPYPTADEMMSGVYAEDLQARPL